MSRPGRCTPERPPLSEPSRRWRTLLAAGLPLLVLAPLAWLWFTSLVPSTYSVLDLGYADYGGGPAVDPPAVRDRRAAVSVADLTGPATGEPDVAVTLIARAGTVRLDSGERVPGYTLNGSSPGPTIRAVRGEIVEVTLVNRNVTGGTTLHWHGVDVPNAEDGVAGVTQDAVPAGGRHVYRFVAEDAGTYWYHSHQVSDTQVRRGQLGLLVIEPASPSADQAGGTDVPLLVHTYDGIRTVNGRSGVSRVDVPVGSRVRVRVVNTDNGRLRVWVSGATYRVLAVDGRDLNGPTVVRRKTLSVPAGGRADLEVVVAAGGARVDVDGGAALRLGPRGARGPRAMPQPARSLDLLTYGAPVEPPFDLADADRSFEYRIGRRPGFVDGRPGFWWSINGGLFPDVPMYVVEEGDLVRVTITNTSGDVHPMHLHGHHALVISRNGEPSTGSPWWVDSLDVGAGETYEIGFVADNPGVWMYHCHNLAHAAEGLVAHLAYAGVTEPYRVGADVGDADNDPE